MTRFCIIFLNLILFTSSLTALNEMGDLQPIEKVKNINREPLLHILEKIKNSTYEARPQIRLDNSSSYVSYEYKNVSIHVSKVAILAVVWQLVKSGWNKFFGLRPECQDLSDEMKHAFMSYKRDDFRYYFENFLGQRTRKFVECQQLAILHQYPLYQFTEFIKYIQILPDYEKYIQLFARAYTLEEMQKEMPDLQKLTYRYPRFIGMAEFNSPYQSIQDIDPTIETVHSFYELLQRLAKNAASQPKYDDKSFVINHKYIADREYSQYKIKRGLHRTALPYMADVDLDELEDLAAYHRSTPSADIKKYTKPRQLQTIHANAQREIDDPLSTEDRNRHMQRINAIDEIKNNEQIWTTNNHYLSHNTINFIKHSKLHVEDYKSCYGNQLQHALHNEIINLLKKISYYFDAEETSSSNPEAIMTFKNPFDKQTLQEIANTLDIARKANKSGAVDLAANLLDFATYAHDCMKENHEKITDYFNSEIETAEILAEYFGKFFQGMKKGVLSGSSKFGEDLAEKLQNPKEVLNGIGTGIYNVGVTSSKAAEKLGRYFVNIARQSAMLVDYPETLNDEIDKKYAAMLTKEIAKLEDENAKTYDEVCTSIRNILEPLWAMEPEELGEITGDYVAQQALNKLTNAAVFRLSNAIISNHGKLTGIATKVGKSIKRTAEIAREAVDLHLLEAQMLKNIAILKVVEKTKVLKAATLTKLQKAQKRFNEAKETATLFIKYTPLSYEVEKLKEKFDRIHKFENLTLKFPIEHVCSWTKNTKGKYTGWHHDYLGFYEKCGLLKVTKEYANGFYDALPFWDKSGKPKTYFPRNWPREKVFEKILESINDCMNNINEGTSRIIEEKIKEGVTIRTVINSTNGEIVSSYPINLDKP